MECKYTRRSTRDQFDSISKPFPNAYPSLTLRADYIPDETPIYMNSNHTFTNNSHTSSTTYLKYASNEQDMKLAGMKIFATIMLNSWRRRREDVKRLMGKVEDLKKGSIKAKNQIHVYNTLFRVEQRRNDELACQLKLSLESIIQAKTSCESLTTSLISLKADKALLEQELTTRYKELDAVHNILSQTKADLFHSMVEQRNLRSMLSKEQRAVTSMESQKNQLINELCQLNTENHKLEERYCDQIKRKDVELTRTNSRVKNLENDLHALQTKAYEIMQQTNNDVRMKSEISNLREQVCQLQQLLDRSVGNRMRQIWKLAVTYNTKTVQAAHMFAFLLLPAMPLPQSDLKTSFL